MKERGRKTAEAIPEIEGYAPELKTINIVTANIVALVVLVLFEVLGLVSLYAIWGVFSLGSLWNCALFMALFVIGIVVHELIHGLTWMWVTRNGFSHLRFGLMPGGAYCHIDVPMTKRKYVIGALMPLLLIGVLPFLLSFAINNLWIMTLGATFISAAMGDVMIVRAIRHEQADTLVYDHPTEPGCVVYRPKAPNTDSSI